MSDPTNITLVECKYMPEGFIALDGGGDNIIILNTKDGTSFDVPKPWVFEVPELPTFYDLNPTTWYLPGAKYRNVNDPDIK